MIKYILGGLTILAVSMAVAIFIFIRQVVPWAEKQVRDAVKRECPVCEFSMGGLTVGWDGLAVADLHLAGGAKGGQWIDFKTRRLVLSPVLNTLLSDAPRLNGLTLENPNVTFFDREEASKPKTSGGELDGAKIVIDGIFFSDGVFTYVRDVKGTHAVFTVHGLNGEIDPNPDRAVANVRGLVGPSGEFQIRLVSPYGVKPLEIDTEIFVKRLNLEDLSVFFKPNAGVELWGILEKGHARSQMVGPTLKSTLFAEYKDFKLRVDKMYDRNEAQTFFTNLGASLAMRRENHAEPAEDKRKSVESKRERGESLVSFILRGLKEASLAVAL